MPRSAMDFASVRKRSESAAKWMFDQFDRKRRPILTEVCRELYPLGVAGLERQSDDIADEDAYDEDHRLLTAAPLGAVRKGACGFKSHLTPNSGGWFRFRAAGESGREADVAMDRLAKAVNRAFAGSRAYDSLYKLYEHLLVAGFACMLVTRHSRDIVRVRTLRLGTYALDVDDEGDVCRMARRFSWPADRIVTAFGGKACPRRVRDAAERGDRRTRFTVWNLVEPNACGDMRAYDPVAAALGLDDTMVYRSVYWIEGARDDDPQGGLLEASGFRVKPIIAPRLDRELGDVYGRGRGLDALCLARGVQSFTYDILGVSGIRGKPPLVVSSEFKDDGFRAGRGGINYARMGEQSKSMAYPLFAQLPDTVDLRESRRDAAAEIGELFFNSSFATIDMLKNQTGMKTATEVDALVRENMELLGPIVMNLERELLDPLVTAVARYAIDAGTPPLEEGDIEALDSVEVEYVSRLHMAANTRRLSDIDAWLGRMQPLAAARPDVLDVVDADAVAREYADLLGVPASVRADERAVAAAREARAEAAKRQEAMQALDAAGRAAKVGSVPVDENHLGGAMRDALAGGEVGGAA